ncbi:MAG: hypothetical protein JST01_28495 [Cyanobacteria bacterium SZAS TMP-1]|nr:hypothetical protein [Cyanobacteria bacterium SZAS TMP-1]
MQAKRRKRLHTRGLQSDNVIPFRCSIGLAALLAVCLTVTGCAAQSAATKVPTSATTGEVLLPYRVIVESSTTIARADVCRQFGDSARVKIYPLNYGSTEVQQYVLSVESSLPREEVVNRLKKVPGITFVSEDKLMKIN